MSDTEKIPGRCPKVMLDIPHYVDIRLAEISQKFKGQKKALKLATTALDYRLNNLNDLHAQMLASQQTFARADEMEVKHLTINEKLVAQDRLINRGVGIILTVQFIILVLAGLVAYFAN